MERKKTDGSPRKKRSVILVLGIVPIVAAAALLMPWNIPKVPSHPDPALNYEQAVQRIEALRSQEPAAMNPVCRLQLLTHQKKVDQAIILVHGYTNCPQQFRELGQRYFDLGYNVLIAPLPHHGLTDRLTDEQAQLTPQELAAYADTAVDIAQGLGDQVTMMGISAGGVTTAWAAQNRSDLDLAVIISPAFGFQQLPKVLRGPVINLHSFLPPLFQWYDPASQANIPPPYSYPRYSIRALAQTIRLGSSVLAKARRAPPAAHKILMVLNANDQFIDKEQALNIVSLWQAYGGEVSSYEFEVGLNLDHDIIDPTHPKQKIDVVYPRLIELTSK